MVAGLGGPSDFLTNYEKYLTVAPIIEPVYARSSGILSRVDGIQFGNAIIELGGGRRVLGEKLDLSVGFTDIAHIGDTVDSTVPLAVIHAASTEQAKLAARMIQDACEVSDSKVEKQTVIHKILTS